MRPEIFIDVDWLDPWEPLPTEGKAGLEAELKREVPPGHALHGQRCTALARRGDCDDVLFATGDGRLAIVHLTYQVETDPCWPETVLLRDIEEFVREHLVPDHHEYTE